MVRRKAKRVTPQKASHPVLPASLPASNRNFEAGWWKLEVQWPDDRGKQFEVFTRADEAHARREQLRTIGLTTHLFFAIPTITWRLVDGADLVDLAIEAELCCEVPADDGEIDQMVCLLPHGHRIEPSSRRHWGIRPDGAFHSW